VTIPMARIVISESCGAESLAFASSLHGREIQSCVPFLRAFLDWTTNGNVAPGRATSHPVYRDSPSRTNYDSESLDVTTSQFQEILAPNWVEQSSAATDFRLPSYPTYQRILSKLEVVRLKLGESCYNDSTGSAARPKSVAAKNSKLNGCHLSARGGS